MSSQGSSQFICRLGVDGTGPYLFQEVCLERGWRMYEEKKNSVGNSEWNLWWRTSGFATYIRQLKRWQFVNHIPSANSICKKDALARNLKILKRIYGDVYNITPSTFALPFEYTELVTEHNKLGRNHQFWICKPVSLCQGKGIYVFKDLSEICHQNNSIVQKYVQNPYLIGGYKFDLRLYVCVPSFHPLTIYIYKEGLVRFATEKYSLNDITNPFRHLTNSSLNKLGPNYRRRKEAIGAGCKWSLQQLRKHLRKAGINDWLLWQRISSLVTLTILSHCAAAPRTINCFEFYGFDVLFDENLRPWLLEVNLSPAFTNDCEVDHIVKKPLLHDLFDLLGLPLSKQNLPYYITTAWWQGTPSNTTYSEEEIERRKDFCMKRFAKIKREPPSKPQLPRTAPTILPSTEKTTLPLVVKTAITRFKKNGYVFGDLSKEIEIEIGDERKSVTRMPNYTINKINVNGVNGDVKIISKVKGKTSFHNKTDLNNQKLCTKPSSYQEYIPMIPNDKSQNVHSGFRGRVKNMPSLVWGNGRNWTKPPGSTGDWIRTYPLGPRTELEMSFQEFNSISLVDRQVKTIVDKVIRYNKLCTKIHETCGRKGDQELNQLLMKQMGLTTEVWLPCA